METKRGHDDEESNGFGGSSKRRLVFFDVVREVMKEDLVNRIVAKMEPIVQRVVREEMKCVVETLQSRSSYDRSKTLGAQGLQLRFDSKIRSTIFTGSPVETENGSLLKVVLIDANSNNIVSSGPMSNSRIEIVAINSDFGSDDREDWPEKEFAAGVVREREGKRPLLVTGEQNVTLRHGVGNITDNVSFTDNSRWTRNGKFKLGVRVVRRDPGDVRIREAISEGFVVKDYRGASYKKKHPPHLYDHVWRLEKIGKEGATHKRLTKFGINNLMDFLRMYHIDSSRLRHILGGKMSDKTWHTIIEHAKECVVDDDKLHVYYGESVGVVFDSTFKPVGVTFDGQNYSSLDALDFSKHVRDEHKTRLVQDVKQQAYKNVTQFIVIDKASVGDLGRPFPSSQPTSNLGTKTRINDFEASTSRATSEHPMTHMFSTWSPNVVTWGQGYEPGFEFLSSIPSLGVHISRTRSKAWCKIRAAVKWWVSFKQARKWQAFCDLGKTQEFI